jgi:starvation-inducible DNA-binding protein
MRTVNAKTQLPERQIDSLKKAPSDLDCDAMAEISSRVRQLLANVFALYVKLQSHEKRSLTKNFHWHMSRPDFCDYHLLLEECEIFDMTDDRTGRARKTRDSLKTTHEVSKEQNDSVTAGLIEKWIDETERRACYLLKLVCDL